VSGLVPRGRPPAAPRRPGLPAARGGAPTGSPTAGAAALDYGRARRVAEWRDLHPQLRRLLVERHLDPPRGPHLYLWIEPGRQVRADGAERETVDLVWATDSGVVQVRAHRDVAPARGGWAMAALVLTLAEARHESRAWVAEPGGFGGSTGGPEPGPTDLLPGVVAATLGNRVVSAVIREVKAAGASETLQVIADHESRVMILRATRQAARPDQLAEAQWVGAVVYARVAHRERWSWGAESRSPGGSLVRRLGSGSQGGRPALGSGR
jgi:hypothetical protein